MSVITKNDGPVAVTGASGYIGSRIVEDFETRDTTYMLA